MQYLIYRKSAGASPEIISTHLCIELILFWEKEQYEIMTITVASGRKRDGRAWIIYQITVTIKFW